MKSPESPSNGIPRREFIRATALAATAATTVGHLAAADSASPSDTGAMPCGYLGKARISRILMGGNLVSGYMHARDLKYAGSLFRAYMTEEKILDTMRVAEQNGINTVFETGADYVRRYNKKYNGHMQFIPHIEATPGQSEASLKDHIQQQVDTGAIALYVWGVSGDKLTQAGAVDTLKKTVELAKNTGLPIGVGSHSLLVPIACEKHAVPCDFYVKTFHSDDYPSATPKKLRKEFIWIDGGEGWYDNMWCINPEETIAFMKTVKKPWLAFKVLAAGAIYPRQAFPHAFTNGADFIAVGMFDFQVKENCDLVKKVVRNTQQRARPWVA